MSSRQRSLSRKSGNRPPKQRYLIYCEGGVTENIYLLGIRADLRATNVSIKLGKKFGEPSQLVEDALAHKIRASNSAEDGFEEYDQVWCVVDVEAPTPHGRLAEALALAEKHSIFCAITNPCFELWLLLHIVDHRSYLTSKQAQRLLDKHLPSYTYGEKDFDYSEVRNGIYEACVRAKRQEEQCDPASRIPDRNPWSSVWKLVEELQQGSVPSGWRQ